MRNQKIMNQKYLTAILKNSGVQVFEYYPEDDKLILYNEQMQAVKEILNYLVYLKKDTVIHPEDRWKAIEFYSQMPEGRMEVRTVEKGGNVHRKEIVMTQINEEGQPVCCVGCVRDVTLEKDKEKVMEELAKKDSLTGLYNHFWGEKMISEYLDHRNPDSSCGIILVDIDNFKMVNDTYGHLFGDKVLVEFSKLFGIISNDKDIMVRFGGDEFVLFLKDVSYFSMVKKAEEMVAAARKLIFKEHDYSITCSAGIYFLPEGISQYSYKQIFENADRALYSAKKNGRNQYVFWDDLKLGENAEERSDMEQKTEKNK